MKLHPVFMLGILLLAGCTEGAPKVENAKPINIDGIIIASDKAVIEGFVVSDAGLPLPDVRISMLGTDNYTNTDRQGTFRFINVTAGDLKLQASHQSYQTHVHPVTAMAGAKTVVNITLLPDQSLGTEYPHLHDHWAGLDAYVLFDAKINLQERNPNNPYPDAYWTAFGALVRPNVGSNEAARWTIPIGKTPHGGPALVLPGTDQMTVTLTWSGDTVRTEGIGICYRDAMYVLKCTPVGPSSPASWTIPVTPEMADSAHQPYTLWLMQIYVTPLNQGQGGLPDVMYGQVHAKIELRRGDLLVDPPHPDFWAEGNERVVLHDDFQTTTGSTSPPALKHAKQLVPPGTTRMRIDHKWSVQGAAGDVPWEFFMRYRGAAMDPYADTATWPAPKATSGSVDDRHLVYEFPVDPLNVDGYYQKSSYWRFTYYQPRMETTGWDLTGVPVRHILIVTAIRDVPAGAGSSTYKHQPLGITSFAGWFV